MSVRYILFVLCVARSVVAMPCCNCIERKIALLVRAHKTVMLLQELQYELSEEQLAAERDQIQKALASMHKAVQGIVAKSADHAKLSDAVLQKMVDLTFEQSHELDLAMQHMRALLPDASEC